MSRTLSPFLGFVVNFALTFVFLTWVAFNFTFMLSIVLPALGFVAGIKGQWINAPSNGEMMLIATVLTVLFAGLMMFGVHAVARYMKVTFALVWIGMPIWLGLMLFGSHSTFIANWNHSSGSTYNGILAKVHSLGFSAGGGGAGVPLLIGAAVAFALAGLCRGDRRRLLVRLVAQGDAGALAEVQGFADRLRTPRERRRLASGLRAAAQAGRTGAQLSMMVDPARASGGGDRLTALAEAFADPLVAVSAQAAAICRRVLCDAADSPLYNPHAPERELGRVLDVLERDLGSGSAHGVRWSA